MMDRRKMILGLGTTLVSTQATVGSGQGSGNPVPDPSTPVHHIQEVGNLVLNADLTKVSTGSGNWSDAATWFPTGVPGSGEKVVISAGHIITYDVSSVAALDWVRVDGELIFSVLLSTKLTVDTLDVSIGGKLTIGTVAAPVPFNIKAEVVIADNGVIDLAYDPKKFSRGVIIEGEIEVFGANVRTFMKVDSAPMTADTSVVLGGTATGWNVGDIIIIGATLYEGYHWDNSINNTRWYQNEDEERTILSISTTNVANDTINFSIGLAHDHDGPASRPDLKTYVGNYSRSVEFRTENHGSVPIHERGHFMMMGPSASADVRYMKTMELGRTDKSISSIEANDVGTMTATTNVRGRYAMHCHHMGITDARRRNPPVFVGNAIYGSPGWGLVQHFSTGNWYRNVAYGCFGAAFVAEAGVENGTWRENLAIFCKGKSWGTPKDTDDYTNGDTGQGGDGLHMVGRMIRCKNNVSISCNQGLSLFHRLVTTPASAVDAEQFQIPDVLRLETGLDRNSPSLHNISNNESIACNRGLYIEKSGPNQQHDYYTFLEGHLAWNVIYGALISYTSKYVMKNFDFVGLDTTGIAFLSAQQGVRILSNWFEMMFIDLKVEGFATAIYGQHHIVNPGDIIPSEQNLVVLRPTYINNDVDWPTFDNTTYGDVLFPTTGSLPGNSFSIAATEFIDGTTSTGYPISFSVDAKKIDGIGSTELYQAGSVHQKMDWRGRDIARYLAAKGYYTDAVNSNRYLIIPMWFTDRLTAENHCFGIKVTLNASRNLAAYTNNGDINNPNTAPTISHITGQTATAAVTKTLDLLTLSGAADSDSDTPTLLAVTRTDNADIFDNGDGTVDYRSDFGVIGNDTFTFWVQDGNGGIAKATCTVTVS